MPTADPHPLTPLSVHEGNDDDWLEVAEVAKILRSSITVVRGLMGLRGGKCVLPWFRHGKKQFVRRDVLRDYRVQVEASTSRMRDPARR